MQILMDGVSHNYHELGLRQLFTVWYSIQQTTFSLVHLHTLWHLESSDSMIVKITIQ